MYTLWTNSLILSIFRKNVNYYKKSIFCKKWVNLVLFFLFHFGQDSRHVSTLRKMKKKSKYSSKKF